MFHGETTMTLTPVRLTQEGEPARHPSVINRAMQDVLFGSDYAPDGSDFEGFAKKKAVPTPPNFERTMVFPFGDGIRMNNAGTQRFVSIGLDYVVTAWRLRAFDAAGVPTPVTAEFAVERIAWDDTVVDLVGAGTPPFVITDSRALGDPDDWTGGDGANADYVRATLISVTPLLATQVVLTVDFQPKV